MTGTILNVVAILVGGGIGVLLGGRMPEKLRQTVMSGLGLFCLGIGLQMFLDTQNSLVVLGSIVVGALLGEWWRIEDGIRTMGAWLEGRVMRKPSNSTAGVPSVPADLARNRFVQGFFTASLLFIIGPIAILGSIQDGLNGDFQLLAVKSIMDGFAALAFASSLGVGVLFSSLPILIYQGGISLLAAQIAPLISTDMMTEMTATGGVLLMAIAISSLLELRPIRSGNFLPALFLAPLAVALMTALGIAWIL